MFSGGEDDDRPSVLEQIQGALGTEESGRTRTQDEPCDECGSTEGSCVHDRDDDWVLCRDCFNDPEILNEYAD